MLKWIQDSYDAEVVCLTVNLGQPGEDYGVIEDKAKRLGALECHVVDAREEFAEDFVAAGDQGQRPLRRRLSALHRARPAADRQARGRVRAPEPAATRSPTAAPARATIRCGSRPRWRTLAPELKTIAPVRSWQMGREEEIAYAREHGIPVKGGTEVAPYSIDDNLWGRSSEGRWIEDLDHAPEDDVFQLVTRPEEAPDEAEIVTVEFEAGVPVALNGERLELVELLERAAEVGCRHGVGIVDHIEDRIVGLKVRDIYEVPAAAILLPAHQELEKLVGTIHQNQFKPSLDQKWAYLVYAGLWWEPLRTDLDAYMDAVNAQVTGDDRPASSTRAACASSPARSPNAVYDADLASFAESGGLFSQTGLARLHRALVAAVADGAPDPPARGGGEG